MPTTSALLFPAIFYSKLIFGRNIIPVLSPMLIFSRKWASCHIEYCNCKCWITHCNDDIMGAITSQITSPTIVYSIFNSGANQRKQQSSASLAFVWRIHRRPVNSPHKWPVTRKKCPFGDVIMTSMCAIKVRIVKPYDFTYIEVDIGLFVAWSNNQLI